MTIHHSAAWAFRTRLPQFRAGHEEIVNGEPANPELGGKREQGGKHQTNPFGTTDFIVLARHI
jgi:hypothetical protein